MGGVSFLFWGGELKKQINEGLRWPPFDILHATTNQKHAGMTEGGWDRTRNHARMLGEHDGNDKPLPEGDNERTASTARMVTSPTTMTNTPLQLTVLTSHLTRAMTV